jgi:tetratricopeptide (TPR) repeat protein
MSRRPASIDIPTLLRLAGIFLLLWSPEGIAAVGSERSYAQGVQAFDQGRYEQALGLFLDARAGGMDEPALDYNLGATFFRLGRYPEARKAFSRAARDRALAPLAYYNIGLCAQRLGEERSARASFERVLRTTDNPRLRALAVEQLDQASAVTPRAMVGFASAGLGYDTNVLLISGRDVLQSTKQDDPFLDLSAYGARQVAGRPDDVMLSVDGSASLLAYYHLSDYDIADLRLGGTAESGGSWNGEAGVHFEYAFVGGEDFTRETLFELATSHEFSTASRLRLHYEYRTIDAVDALYRYLDGRRQRLDARLTLHRKGRTLDLAYELETNDRRDLRAPLFASYSPVRNGVRLVGELPLTNRLGLEAEGRYLHSRYRDPNELADGGLQRRVDERTSAGLRLIYSLDGDSEVSLEYLYLQNRSSIARYDYVQNLVTLSASRIFQ